MIKIDRGAEPELFKSDFVQLVIEKLEEFYSSGDRSQKRYDFPFNSDFDGTIKDHLHTVFHGKCGYCEVAIDDVDQGVVDRFRPYAGIRDKKEYYPDLYWWLTFKWDNLVYCCKECSQYKANYFPIIGTRAITEKDDLSKEEPLLLNPCRDDPEPHFDYGIKGRITGLTEKGVQTIDLLRLNRLTHLNKRLQARAQMITIVDALNTIHPQKHNNVDIEYLQRIYKKDPAIEFLAFKRRVLIEKIEDFPFLRTLLGISPAQFSKHTKKEVAESRQTQQASQHDFLVNDYFPIESIRIQHFKGISDLTIDFKEDGIEKRSWLFLLGENGVGKSSILQAIAVGVKKNDAVLQLLLPALIQKGQEKAEITIKERDSDNVLTTVLTKDSVTQTGTFSSFLLGYGSLRLSVDEVDENPRQDEAGVSYENLFKPIKPLNDITAWLKNIHSNNPKFFDVVAYSIKQLLPHDFPESDLTVENGEIMFRNSKKLFSELSDGFKSTIILAVDIMMKLSSAQADMDKLSGIVLIDELGNQLHPRWQMRIVKQLRTVFKNINFIVSTHHPLCLRGSESREILLLKNNGGSIVPVTELPDPASLRVDQILASEFFGLSSLIDPELEAKFNQYYAILAKEDKISPEERKKLDVLKDELRSQKQLGASLREELMYTVIDRLLASQLVYDKKPLPREQLKDEVVQRVKDIWSRLNMDSYDQS